MPVLDRAEERLSDFYAIKARGPEAARAWCSSW